MRQKLKDYCDACKYFLPQANSIQDCLVEAQNTQKYLAELIFLKAEIDSELRIAQNKYDIFMADKREAIFAVANKLSTKNMTSQVIEDKVKKFERQDYLFYKELLDTLQIEFEMCTNLLMAMYQRKDLITETIKFFQIRKDTESCIMRNKDIAKKLGLS